MKFLSSLSERTMGFQTQPTIQMTFYILMIMAATLCTATSWTRGGPLSHTVLDRILRAAHLMCSATRLVPCRRPGMAQTQVQRNHILLSSRGSPLHIRLLAQTVT